MNRRVVLLAPLGVAVAGGAAFLAMLSRMESGTFDPRSTGNPLIGKPVPDFTLPGDAGKPGFSNADLIAAGRPILLNFFASWCVPCVEEHPVLMDISQQGLPLWGIAYKDKPAASATFIARHGDPYMRIGADEPGRTAIDFGLTGVPETFLVDRAGIIRWHIAGPLTPEMVEQDVKPLLKKYV